MAGQKSQDGKCILNVWWEYRTDKNGKRKLVNTGKPCGRKRGNWGEKS